MSQLANHDAIGGGNYRINNSLRFRASASAYLSRTPGVAGNLTTWTWSGWVKRGALATNEIFAARAGNEVTLLRFSGDTIVFLQQNASIVLEANYVTTAVYRDPSAWYHIVLAVATTQATAANRVLLYVNGAAVSLTASTTIAQNTDTHVNRTIAHAHGIQPTEASLYLDGYLSEVNFIDGQALGPSSFGETDPTTGQWVAKRYTGTYGTNGFYLPFNDGTSTTTLCQDRSGNGNNWTPSGISVTAGATYDWMKDVPAGNGRAALATGNYAVLNALYTGRSTLTNANLTASGATDLPTIVPDSGTWYFERGGVAQTWTPPAAFPAAAGDYNFGQRPWQAAGPSGGQKALHTGNLPTPTIKNPADHFNVVLATGANIKTTAEATFPGNFLEWIKDRANANNHQLIDTVRGTAAVLQSNTSAAETTYVAPAGSSVGWVWKAGGAAVANNAGTIASQVSANVTAGLSVVTYTGTGANATVGHGLGVAPKLVITKGRTVSGTMVGNWFVYHAGMNASPATGLLKINTTAAFATASDVWNNTAPTSSVVSLGSNVDLNNSGTGFIAYCFAEIPGYSKFGSYTGNGSADGPFVFCGFRPRFVLIKQANVAGDWRIWDTQRNAYNVSNTNIYPNLTNAEDTDALHDIDITANGFKIRTAWTSQNASGDAHIFAAFAEAPFNCANAR